MAINWDTIITISITQAISTSVMFYTLKFLNETHDKLEKNGKVKVKDEDDK